MDFQCAEYTRQSEILVAPKFQRALSVLLDATVYALHTGSDPWDFAVEIHHLRRIGLTENDLRFLVRLQYLDHAREAASTGDSGRNFQQSSDFSFAKRTCFILTPEGINAATQKLIDSPRRDLIGSAPLRISAGTTLVHARRMPHWDSQRRVLSFDGKVVKQFRWQAANQEMVLAAFQEENWPIRIFDPLAPHPSQVMKRRLSDTIKCLNRGRQAPLIRFRGDGTGEGVLWEAAV